MQKHSIKNSILLYAFYITDRLSQDKWGGRERTGLDASTAVYGKSVRPTAKLKIEKTNLHVIPVIPGIGTVQQLAGTCVRGMSSNPKSLVVVLKQSW